MATRLYFTERPHSLTIPKRSSWTQNCAPNNFSLATWQARTAKVAAASSATWAAAHNAANNTTNDAYWASFLTPPLLNGGTFSGTFSMVLDWVEQNLGENKHLAYALRIMQGDTTTERGLLASSFTTLTELSDQAHGTRIINAVAVAGVTATAGDRICLEIGLHSAAGTNSGLSSVNIRYSTADADYALTSGLTTVLTPWFEFSINLVFGRAISLAGAQPAESGTLTRIKKPKRLELGSQPAESGTLTRVEKPTRSLAGNQPAETGVLSRDGASSYNLAGNQPAEDGTLSQFRTVLRTMTGNQSASTGDLNRQASHSRGLNGAQPAAAGLLSRRLVLTRLLNGQDPAANGLLDLATSGASLFTRNINGTQPAASGLLDLVVDHVVTAMVIRKGVVHGRDRTHPRLTASDRTTQARR